MIARKLRGAGRETELHRAEHEHRSLVGTGVGRLATGEKLSNLLEATANGLGFLLDSLARSEPVIALVDVDGDVEVGEAAANEAGRSSVGNGVSLQVLRLERRGSPSEMAAIRSRLGEEAVDDLKTSRVEHANRFAVYVGDDLPLGVGLSVGATECWCS